MNELIMSWSSKTFYFGKLYASEAVKNHKISDLPDVFIKDDQTKTVLKLYDTSSLGMGEISNNSKKSPSFANKGEAAVVINYVEELIRKGMKPDEIAVITPYNYQVILWNEGKIVIDVLFSFKVEVLSANLLEKYEDLEIKSVDGFQGREKEVVIIIMQRWHY